jgi:hypothetical protein
MGRQGMVKPDMAMNFIVTQRLNAQRISENAKSDLTRSPRYLIRVILTQRGILTGA